MTGRLLGKICLVVGGGSPEEGDVPSNGEAVAIAFAREGAKVVVVDLDVGAAERTLKKVRCEQGEGIAVRGDASRHADVRAAVEAAMSAYGRIDVLYNNVGIEVIGGVVDTTEEAWDRVHAVNLKSVFLACKEVVPIMERQGGGVILNVSSVASLRWGPVEYIGYNSSKAAINHMSRVMARQYAPKKIRCNVIVPGMIDSPHVRSLYKDRTPEELAAVIAERNFHCPLGRQGSAWDLANAAVFLASDEAAYISGVLLPVDGALCC